VQAGIDREHEAYQPPPRAPVLIESEPVLWILVLTCFLYANRFPPPDQVRGRASLENALVSIRTSGCRHRHGRTEAGSSCPGTRWLLRGSSRPALRNVNGRQIRSELPGRARTGRIMVLQEQEQRRAEAALGETSRAAMTGHATIRKQPRARFALIEILSVCHSPEEQIRGAENEKTPPQSWLRHKPR